MDEFQIELFCVTGTDNEREQSCRSRNDNPPDVVSRQICSVSASSWSRHHGRPTLIIYISNTNYQLTCQLLSQQWLDIKKHPLNNARINILNNTTSLCVRQPEVSSLYSYIDHSYHTGRNIFVNALHIHIKWRITIETVFLYIEHFTYIYP